MNKKAKKKATANLGDDNEDPNPDDNDNSDDTSPATDGDSKPQGDGDDIQALLATCMNLAQNHPLARDSIAEALGHFSVPS